jgi:hypothetical protein
MFEYVKIGAVGVNFHSNDWNSFDLQGGPSLFSVGSSN